MHVLQAVPQTGKLRQSFVSIKQQFQEPYMSFLDRLKNSVKKQIDKEQERALVFQQLAIENANADYQKVLLALKNSTTKEFAQEKALEWKLSELSNWKQGLQTLSLWHIDRRKRRIKSPGLVAFTLWEQELGKLLLRRMLVFGRSLIPAVGIVTMYFSEPLDVVAVVQCSRKF